jgi:hypothetical protein
MEPSRAAQQQSEFPLSRFVPIPTVNTVQYGKIEYLNLEQCREILIQRIDFLQSIEATTEVVSTGTLAYPGVDQILCVPTDLVLTFPLGTICGDYVPAGFELVDDRKEPPNPMRARLRALRSWLRLIERRLAAFMRRFQAASVIEAIVVREAPAFLIHGFHPPDISPIRTNQLMPRGLATA